MQQRYIDFYVDLMLSDLYRNYLFMSTKIMEPWQTNL